MTTTHSDIIFSTLLSLHSAHDLLGRLESVIDTSTKVLINGFDYNLSATQLNCDHVQDLGDEYLATEWLIALFNHIFIAQKTRLVRGQHEPEYFPATITKPARIEFAHGFFASALHELSHWCIAGYKRRQVNDFGYWYAPDGRTAAQQQAFERVEIKPQAIECLFTLACKREFKVSQDNLFADFDTSNSTFAIDVYEQATRYIIQPTTLPKDAQTLLYALLTFFYAP